MSGKLTTVLMMLPLATSYSSQHSFNFAPTVNTAPACILFAPITIHGNDAKLLDVRTVSEINAHNAIWDLLCKQMPKN